MLTQLTDSSSSVSKYHQVVLSHRQHQMFSSMHDRRQIVYQTMAHNTDISITVGLYLTYLVLALSLKQRLYR